MRSPFLLARSPNGRMFQLRASTAFLSVASFFVALRAITSLESNSMLTTRISSVDSHRPIFLRTSTTGTSLPILAFVFRVAIG